MPISCSTSKRKGSNITLPKLAVANSGWGGRGYKNPVTKDKLVVPSITTVLKAESKPAIAQWVANQTAGYAVANAEALLTHSEDWGYKMLRFYWNRTPKVNAETSILNYHEGVLDDASEMGSWTHEYIQADVEGSTLEYPDLSVAHDSHWEMVEEWNRFKSQHDIRPHYTEKTVWNGEFGYAGTMDGIWEFDGKLCLMDIKTSRGLYTSTWMQLAALWNAKEMFVPQDDDNYMSLTGWQDPIEDIGVLHIRPKDWDHRGRPMPAFCRWTPARNLDEYWAGFQGLLAYGKAMRDVRVLERIREKNGE